MDVPILRLGPYLIATVRSELTDADLLQLQDALAKQVGEFRSEGVIVDVTMLDVMDSFAARTLRNLVEIVRLRGAEAVIVGVRPDVALAMVQLGLDLRLAGIATALDLDEGLALLGWNIDREHRRGPG